MPTLAFDVYGTLIDTSGIAEALKPFAGEAATLMAQRWREKQLEYTFRRALMHDYVDFAVCTRQSLDYTCMAMGIALSPAQRDTLLAQYRCLPAFADAQAGLHALQNQDLRLFAFSNGRVGDVEALLQQAGLRDYFEGIVSLTGARTFKPAPTAYAWFLEQSGSAAHETWLISGNPFDVLGSMAAGYSAAWLQRSTSAIFDPWERKPNLIVNSLIDLAEKFVETA